MKYLLRYEYLHSFILEENQNLVEKINKVGLETCAISEITLAELIFWC